MSTATGMTLAPTRKALSEKILAIKTAMGWSWEDLTALTEKSLVWTAAALSGQCALLADQATAVGEKFELDEIEIKVLQTYPYRGSLDDTVPTDPFVYRFFEIMQVYGIAMKDVAQEEFGDGIMSAIDFSIDVQREPDPKGDRVKIVFSGKFLPYKQF
jgi:cyanate lyase